MAKRKTHDAAPTSSPAPTFEQAEDFDSLYANSARYESTVWDLKIIFGQIELTSGAEVVKQHTAMTLPWSLVKVAAYWLQLNVAIQETLNGKVLIPPSQLPPHLPPPTPEQEADPAAMKIREIAKKLREEFMSKL
jgi:hypothetical protein